MLIRFKKNDGTEYPQWEEKRLGEICKLDGGFAFQSELFKELGIPIIRISNIENGSIDLTHQCAYYNEIPEANNFIAHTGDLLIAMSGATTGKTGVYRNNKKAYINQRVGKFRALSGKVYYPYLYQWVITPYFTKQLYQRLSGCAQPNISSKDIETMKICLPESLEEQQKIADFLSTVDQKIEVQRIMVNDYKELKKGTMQKIFNQEIKFKDDDGNEFPEWEEISVEKVIEEYNIKTTVNNEYPILSSTHSGIVLQNEYFNKQTASEDNTGYKIVPAGYFTYRAMSDTGKFVFNQQTLLDKGIVSPAYPVFKVVYGNETFFRLFMNDSRYVKSQILMNKEGSTRFALSISKLKNLKIKMPCLKEQKKIADCLSALDRKIEAENKILADLEELKRGLLQGIFNN